MTLQDIKPGTIVKDKKGQINFGLPMQVIAEKNEDLMVAYTNLDGNYQENWLAKIHASCVDKGDQKIPCPAFQ